MPRLLIGNVKGVKGDTGSQGPQGVAGTIEIGSVQTVSYGSPASVTNSGTEEEAILDFQIPQGAPGATVTDMSNLGLSSITDSTADYPSFAVGENGSTIFGKIRKFLSDLKNNYVSKSMMTTSTNIDTAGQAVADAKAIKSLNDSLANIGTFTESGWVSDVPIPATGTVTEVATISVPAGTYVVFAAFSSTGTTKPERAYITYRYSGTAPSVIQSEDFIGRTTLIIGFIVKMTSAGTIGASCRAWSAIKCSGSIRAVRIK